VVDEDAGELLADGAVDECAATEESTPPERPRITSFAADLALDLLDRFGT